MPAPARKRTEKVPDPSEHVMRDQEVLRATRELAAYFKGKRTEREARSALKIIKAYIRDREHTATNARRPLPGIRGAKPAAPPPKKRKRSSPRRKPRQQEALPDSLVVPLAEPV